MNESLVAWSPTPDDNDTINDQRSTTNDYGLSAERSVREVASRA
jgi:hypothetical protein